MSTEPSFIAEILKPGSSLNSTFFLIVDGVLATLLVVLLSLAYLTLGNLHVFVLIGIELALWASVKWRVNPSRRRQTTGLKPISQVHL
jgi:hypothetical protein